MVDKTTKVLLTTIAGLLCALLLRPLFIVPPAIAQPPNQATQPSQMVADHGAIYVLQNGKLYVYALDNDSNHSLLPKRAQLRFLSSRAVDTQP